MEEAVTALDRTRDAAANDLAVALEVRRDRFPPRGLRTIDSGGWLARGYVVSEIRQRFPDAVVRTVDIVVNTADFHHSRRRRLFADFDVGQAAKML
jgi:hypothetical protein